MTMSTLLRNAIIACGLMIGASATSIALTPTIRVVDGIDHVDLELLLPKQFGGWRHDEQAHQAVINPQTQEFLNQLYSQTLSRTYVNNEGRRIMLSLAYGADQSHDNQIHKPEVCYPAQGFQIISKHKDEIDTSSGSLPVMRVITEMGRRHEPVTYWIRVGDTVVRGAVEQNLARIRYGLDGRIPDGILFRVSEINADASNSFKTQDQFVEALLPALTPAARKMLVGGLGADRG